MTQAESGVEILHPVQSTNASEYQTSPLASRMLGGCRSRLRLLLDHAGRDTAARAIAHSKEFATVCKDLPLAWPRTIKKQP